jgi:hypothetical protein
MYDSFFQPLIRDTLCKAMHQLLNDERQVQVRQPGPRLPALHNRGSARQQQWRGSGAGRWLIALLALCVVAGQLPLCWSFRRGHMCPVAVAFLACNFSHAFLPFCGCLLAAGGAEQRCRPPDSMPAVSAGGQLFLPWMRSCRGRSLLLPDYCCLALRSGRIPGGPVRPTLSADYSAPPAILLVQLT